MQSGFPGTLAKAPKRSQVRGVWGLGPHGDRAPGAAATRGGHPLTGSSQRRLLRFDSHSLKPKGSERPFLFPSREFLSVSNAMSISVRLCKYPQAGIN